MEFRTLILVGSLVLVGAVCSAQAACPSNRGVGQRLPAFHLHEERMRGPRNLECCPKHVEEDGVSKGVIDGVTLACPVPRSQPPEGGCRGRESERDVTKYTSTVTFPLPLRKGG
uniref:Putative secreted salivary peptide n=1 Tax=Ixodes ricinus TaxID=34613 RepID=V5HA18_IXORI